jgi:3-hydroxyisobutyrate dehydrogenase-like beta-hydroxyacid dehydrogenase
MESIGIIGLGKMGLAIAKRLLLQNCSLVGYDRRREAVRLFASLGGVEACSPRDIAGKAQILILSLPNSEANEEVILGSQGIVHVLQQDSLVIDMGSSMPASTRMLGARLAEKGACMIDAPVSGGPRGVQAGTLAIMIGGAQQDIDRAWPIFAMLSATEKMTVVGSLGSAHLLKAVNNYLYASALWASSEAMVVAAKAGLDIHTVLKVLSTSSGHNRAVEDNIPNEVLNRAFPVSFSLELLIKDLGTFVSIAEEMEVSIPAALLLKELYQIGLQEVGQGQGDSKIITLLEKWAGIEVTG